VSGRKRMSPSVKSSQGVAVLAGGERHGVGLAHPAVGEGFDVEDGEGFSGWLRFGGEAVHDGAGCVGGAIVRWR